MINDETPNWTLETRTISLALAGRMLEAARAKAEELGISVTIAITDGAGHLKAFAAMDGAGLMTRQIAQNKAYTAAITRRATHEMYERLKENPPLMQTIANLPRMAVVGGGLPILADGQVMGAIGVSGGTAEQDIQVAEAALALAQKLVSRGE